jgi:hypothetical protein
MNQRSTIKEAFEAFSRTSSDTMKNKNIEKTLHGLAPQYRSIQLIHNAWAKLFDIVANTRAKSIMDHLLTTCTLQEAKNRFLDEESKRVIEGRLSALGTTGAGKQAIRNIESEHQFLGLGWHYLFDAMKAVDPTPDSITRFTAFAFQNFTLTGPELTKCIDLQSTIFGRIMRSEQLAENCAKTTKQSVAISSGNIAKRRKLPKNVKLGSYHMWSTFIPGSTEPFSGLPSDSKHFCCRLGLEFDGKSWVKMRYTLPLAAPPRVATIADAYAGTDWNYYFCVCPRNEPFGRTMPCNDCKHETGAYECVHEVITSDFLRGQLEELS